ncbi:hypothetical protein [uncultured Pontibacter sp.]|uniref:hypothetical protein n=1 Tax=uncultured Pontibacter sp. TaxID=453356 RepID=UPI002635B9F2|nr:hypothetical protein [uncultured Pontibacter sp.]
MKKLFLLAFLALAFTSCDKDESEAVEPVAIVHKEIKATFKYTLPIRVDINNDGQDDFSFGNVLVSDSYGAHNLFYIRPLAHNQVLLNMNDEIAIGNWSAALKANDVVQEDQINNLKWVRGTGFLLDLRKPDATHTFYEGPLSDKAPLYIGVRLEKNGGYHTGWVKLNYAMGSEEVEVTDAAFNPLSMQILKAGQR